MIGSSYTKNKNIKIFLHKEYGSPVYVGVIDVKNNTLKIVDKDNLYTTKGYVALGVDKEVLNCQFRFGYISFKFKDEILTTSRKYFIDEGKHFDLLNGRDMLFVEINKINMEYLSKYTLDRSSEQLKLI